MNKGYQVLALKGSTAVFCKNYKRLGTAEKKYDELCIDKKLFVSLTDETDIKIVDKGIFRFISGNKNIKHRSNV